METRAHHVLIGLFTVLIVSGALLFALWLAKSSSDRDYQYYDVIFREAVTGLSEGSGVQFSGIKVGDVIQLRLDQDDPGEVHARIRVAASTPIRQDTEAKLAMTGITGGAIIQLRSGRPDSPRLYSAPGNIPKIIAQPSPLTQLLSDGGDMMSNLNQLLISANRMLSEENAASISKALDNLQLTTTTIAAERENLGRALAQMGNASEQATLAIAEVKTLLHTSNGLLDQQGSKITGHISKILASMERSGQQIELMLSENRGAVGRGVQGLNELGPTLRELRQTLKGVQEISRKLENPSEYFLGGGQTQEFRP
ncbi:phospholipid/cholesterol/gamma-HCH transport system substrate-binding protein [Azomonas agilis]|uniref:Phospholipid/cholesterol/gamma-HCH transport system substrate-binding protein n=1 Tax=Azomonas agilis TaxID=116849 RepID=A0A562I1Q4_9GAMM|nr:MlaD family protein [Azomonas agilis]TWH64624.1 phospholipid/cholesterol/gamma-HCH transport system substrate-binding protein [Azomonas agilis]